MPRKFRVVRAGHLGPRALLWANHYRLIDYRAPPSFGWRPAGARRRLPAATRGARQSFLAPEPPSWAESGGVASMCPSLCGRPASSGPAADACSKRGAAPAMRPQPACSRQPGLLSGRSARLGHAPGGRGHRRVQLSPLQQAYTRRNIALIFFTTGSGSAMFSAAAAGLGH